MAFRSTKARQTAPTEHRVPRRPREALPILYTWKPETGFDASTTYAGFSTQNVQAAIPEAVGQGKDGFLTLQDRPHIAAAVNAIKELASKLTDLATIVAGYADRFTTKELSFQRATGEDLTLTHQLCIDRADGAPVCVTGDQLAALLSQAAAPTLPTSVISPRPQPRRTSRIPNNHLPKIQQPLLRPPNDSDPVPQTSNDNP